MGGETLREHSGQGVETDIRVPCLTLAYHHDTRRVGEQMRMPTLLVGKTVAVSRLEGAFQAGRDRAKTPLNDPFISRSPLNLSLQGEDLWVDASQCGTSVQLDGESLTAQVALSPERVENGVTIQLGDRVVLCLHMASVFPVGVGKYGLLGNAHAMGRLRQEIARVAPEGVPVLLRGESGSGKELVARAIHKDSRRASKPFVVVNMGAITASTAASELFGHVRGAFTGSVGPHSGYFGEADGGTLFLDEIGETPSSVQPVLLRALDTGEIQPVGGRQAKQVDVRILAATDANLERAVDEESFRVALLHRLAGYEIHVPTARSRREDIAILFFHFLREQLEEMGMAASLITEPLTKDLWVPAGLVARLVRYDWPGNIRQLRNVSRQLAIASKGEARLRLNDAVARLLPAGADASKATSSASGGSVPSVGSSGSSGRARRVNLDTISDEMVIEALRRNQWKIAATSRDLGVSKNSLYQLMDRCALIRKARDLSAEEIQAAGHTCGGDSSKMAVALEVSLRGLKLRMTELDLT
jgi:two-component system nitrogen regulation response regulator GlnG